MNVIWPAARSGQGVRTIGRGRRRSNEPAAGRKFASTQAPTIGAAALPVMVPLIDAVGRTLGLAAAALALRGATMASATLARTIPGRTNFMNLPRIGVRGLIISPRSFEPEVEVRRTNRSAEGQNALIDRMRSGQPPTPP